MTTTEITYKTIESGLAKVYYTGADGQRRLVGKVRRTREYSSTRTGFTWEGFYGGKRCGYGHTTREAAGSALVAEYKRIRGIA